MPLVLTLTLDHATVLSGAPIPLTVTLTNGTDRAVSAPSPDAPTVFEYGLVDAATGAPRGAFSVLGAIIQRTDDPRRRKTPQVVLAAGDALTWRDDLAALAVTPLPPGAYAVRARWFGPEGVIESPPAALSVVALRAAALSAHWDDARGSLAAAFAPPAAAAVYWYESRRAAPRDGLWYAREAPPAVAVAVTVDLEPDPDDLPTGRGLAVLSGDSLGASLVEGESELVRFDAAPVGLHALDLHPVGWRLDVRTVAFVGVGVDASGAAALAWARFRTREAPTVTHLPLETGAAPTRWRATAWRTAQGVVLDLVLAYSLDGVTSLVRVRAYPDQGALEPAVTIGQTPEALVALAMPPAGATAFDALFGPSEHPPRMLLTRLALDGSATLGAWTVTTPLDSSRTPPWRWALDDGLPALPALACHLGPLVLGWRAGDASWRTLEAGVTEDVHLRLVTPAPWGATALWIDPNRALMLRRLDGGPVGEEEDVDGGADEDEDEAEAEDEDEDA